MTVAIIGAGNIGGRLAANLTAGGVDVLLAARNLTAVEQLAQGLDGHATAVGVAQAIDRADVIVLATWFDTSKELVAEYGDKLIGKIVVDPSNPIAADGKGGFRKTIGEHDSSGQILSALLPKGAHLVKAFGTLGMDSLAAAARREPELAVQFYAADDETAGGRVAELIRAGGFEPVRVGGIDQSIRVEVGGDLHEYGALGGVVDRAAALEAI